jgi:transposase
MPKTWSQDLRDRVLSAYDRGMKTTPIAKMFKVSPSWARRVKQRRRELGETSPRRRGGVSEIKVDRTRLAELVRDDPEATLMELRQRLGVACAVSTISTVLNTLRLTFKKRRCMPRSRIGRMSSRDATNGGSGNPTSTCSD